MTTVVWRLNPYTGSTVWTYGNYGGPGWTGGEFTPPGQPSSYKLPPADGTDTVFRDHDAAYEAAQKVYKASGHTQADQIADLRAIIKADEAMLASLKDIVNDPSLNGTIDTGRELFGVDTRKSNGQLATDGFDALKDLDANGDGKIDAADGVFANLGIWRDLTQDGISQANELNTLAERCVSIKLTSGATSINYGDAVLVQNSTFTRTDGSAGQVGSFVLAQNNFAREFAPIVVSDAAKALPGLNGSGWVRDLREAGRVREFA